MQSKAKGTEVVYCSAVIAACCDPRQYRHLALLAKMFNAIRLLTPGVNFDRPAFVRYYLAHFGRVPLIVAYHVDCIGWRGRGDDLEGQRNARDLAIFATSHGIPATVLLIRDGMPPLYCYGSLERGAVWVRERAEQLCHVSFDWDFDEFVHVEKVVVGDNLRQYESDPNALYLANLGLRHNTGSVAKVIGEFGSGEPLPLSFTCDVEPPRGKAIARILIARGVPVTYDEVG